MTLKEVLEFLIEAQPGRTDKELAQAIYADAAKEAQVVEACAQLLAEGKVRDRDDADSVDHQRRLYPAS